MKATVKSTENYKISNIIWNDFDYFLFANFKLKRWTVVDIDVEYFYDNYIYVCRNICRVNNNYYDKYFAIDDLEFKYNFEKEKLIKLLKIKDILE
jgi:hypothetical protein